MPRQAGANRTHCARALALALVLALLLPGCEKWQLDAQVRELCARDGGMKIYETVALPAEQFDQWGVLKTFRPTEKENSLGPDYAYLSESTYFRRGNPEMWRSHVSIVRRRDGKVLGETVRYSRRGGDAPGPWADSYFSCPPIDPSQPDLLRRVFVTIGAQ